MHLVCSCIFLPWHFPSFYLGSLPWSESSSSLKSKNKEFDCFVEPPSWYLRLLDQRRLTLLWPSSISTGFGWGLVMLANYPGGSIAFWRIIHCWHISPLRIHCAASLFTQSFTCCATRRTTWLSKLHGHPGCSAQWPLRANSKKIL